MSFQPSFVAIPDLMRDIGIGIGNAAKNIVELSRTSIGTLAVKDADVGVEFEMTSNAVSSSQSASLGLPILGAKTLSISTAALQKNDSASGHVSIKLHIVAVAESTPSDESTKSDANTKPSALNPSTRTLGLATVEHAHTGPGDTPSSGEKPKQPAGTKPTKPKVPAGTGRPQLGIDPADARGQDDAEALRKAAKSLTASVQARELPETLRALMLAELDVIGEILNSNRVSEGRAALIDFATRYGVMLG